MTARRRWALVAALVAVLVAAPLVIAALPVDDSELTAEQVLERVRGSAEVSYSGYAQSVGGVVLPVDEQLPELVELFADRTSMRVYWRGTEDWRVDTVTATGETGVHRRSETIWTWEYERNRATRTATAPLHTPRPDDVLPSELGRRLLSEAEPAELRRIRSEVVAGIDAVGVRLTPSEQQASIDAVDIWVDPESGLPLRVSVEGGDGAAPVLSTSFLDIELVAPAADTTRFAAPPGTQTRVEEVPDLVSAADRFGRIVPPDTLGGLPRRTQVGGLGAVGDYGRGVTLLIAVPLPRDLAEDFRRQLLAAPGVDVAGPWGTELSVGPFAVLLTRSEGDRSFLLTGTVDAATVEAAAAELAADPPPRR